MSSRLDVPGLEVAERVQRRAGSQAGFIEEMKP